jgi:ribonuclease HI
MQSFPVLTGTRNALSKTPFLGTVLFRRIFRRRIASSSTLIFSSSAEFLESGRCFAIMEGQPWASFSPLPPSASKEMKLTRQKSYEQHTGTDKPLLKKNNSREDDYFVSSQRNQNDMYQLRLSPEKNYLLRVKGHTTPRSGGAGIGLILEDSFSNQTVWSARLYVSGDRTPFEAEYSAIILGMDYACNILKARRLTVFSSNDIIVNQIQGIFAVTKSSLEILLKTIKRIQRQFQRQLRHVSIEESPPTDNSEATVQAMKAFATRT